MALTSRILIGALALGIAGGALAQFDGPAPLAWRWSEATSAIPAGAPVADGDTVFTAVGGRIYALERETGNLLWRYPAGVPLESNFRTGLTLSNGRIVAASDQKVVYCVDAKTGQLAWQASATDPVIGTPSITGNAVVFPLSNSSIGGVSLADGQPLWEKPITSSARILPNINSWQGAVIFGTANSELVAVDLANGRERWRTRFQGRLSAEMTPVVYGDGVYITSDNFIVALRASTGRARWQDRVPERLVFGPGVGPDGVLAVDVKGTVYPYDLNGRKMTRAGFVMDTVPQASPSWVGRFIVVAGTGGEVILIDPKSGERLWNYMIPPLSRTISSGAAGGGGAMGGPSAGGGGRDGGSGGGAMGAGGSGAAGVDTPVLRYVTAAGPAAEAGGTLLIMARDGSLLAFDRTNGVDLTPPLARMVWPSAGDQISPNPASEFVFSVNDLTSGVRPESVKMTINGQEAVGEYKDGFFRVLFLSNGKNRIPRGKITLVVTASDWLGNTSRTTFTLYGDASIARPLGAPPRGAPGSQQGGGPGAGGGGAGF